MKNWIVWSLAVFMLVVGAGCSDSDVSTSDRPVSLHYSTTAPDLIDISRYEGVPPVVSASGVLGDLALAAVDAAESLGTALDKDPRTRVLIKKTAADGAEQLYADNYLMQVATQTGVREVMARLDAQYESELFALDEAAIYALPFRFVAVPQGTSMVHVCMVDPVAYLQQFTTVSSAVRDKLNEAVAHFEDIIHTAFPDAYFDPQRQNNEPPIPETVAAIITLGQKTGTLDSISDVLETGTLYYNDTAFGSGIDEFGDQNGEDGPEDIFNLYEDPATRPFVEIRAFVPFSTFKAFRKGSTFNVSNMTDTMAFLVENSVIHIYDGSDRCQVYDVNGKTVYQLQVFDANVDPMLISRGVSHFAGVPMNIYLTEANGLVTVTMQNPAFKHLRYYSDMSPELLSSLRDYWNSADPVNKLPFPDMTVEEFGQFSLDTCRKVYDAAMSAF